MKRLVHLSIIALFVLASAALAAGTQQELTLNDGRVLKGETVERDGLVTVTTPEGRLFQMPVGEVKTRRPLTAPEVSLAAQPVQVAQASPGASLASPAASAAPAADGAQNPLVVLETSKGSITLELFEDDAPNTVANFISLVESGTYDGTIFHRIIRGFMMQGGDPNTKQPDESTWGRGGPGYAIDDECGSDPKWKNVRGAISMANAGANTNGSQFFIIFQDQPHLDGKHTVFGKVVEGMNVIDDIEKTVAPAEGGEKPLSKLELKKATVKRKRDHKYQPQKNANR